MTWYGLLKMSQLPPEIKSHLKERGLDTTKNLVDYDKETGTVYLRLYSPSGQLIGFQEYHPEEKNKRGKNRDKRYYNDIPDPNYKPTAFWGSQNIDPNKPYLFVTEGIFDAAPINKLGEPAIALLSNNVSGSKLLQLQYLGKKLIAILDNDKAGNQRVNEKQRFDRVRNVGLRSAIQILGGKSFVTPDPYKDFGEMYQQNSNTARQFIEGITSII